MPVETKMSAGPNRRMSLLMSAVSQMQDLREAYNAVFINSGNLNAETENEFLDSLMVGLLFSSSEGKPDENFIYKVRRLANFKQDLYKENKPVPCNNHFRFEYFRETSFMKKQCFAFIQEKRAKIVPVEIDEKSEVFQFEDLHYREKECTCCTEEQLELTDQLTEYLVNFKVLTSVIKNEEILVQEPIGNKEMSVEMLKFLEKEETMEVN